MCGPGHGLTLCDRSDEPHDEGDRTREMTEWFGRVIGLALRWFDIEINLAPVVDIHREPVTRGLERRCFGADAPTVIELAGGFIRGQASQGTASCLKHFPGLSLGSGDPHYGTTVIDLSLEEMKQADLQPYVALGNEAQAVMIGHAIYPKLEEKGRPASLSYNITTEILRNVVGFNGIAFSDDMEMHAVSDLGGVEEVTVRALFAGNDVILHCAHIEQIPKLMEHLERRAATDPEFGIRFREATGRAEAYQGFIDALRETHPLEASSFSDVQDAVAEFVDAFERAGGHFTAARPLPPAAGADRRTYPRYREDGQKVDRREEERKKGTGPTGREEWT